MDGCKEQPDQPEREFTPPLSARWCKLVPWATHGSDYLWGCAAIKEITSQAASEQPDASRDMKLYSTLPGCIGILTESCVLPQVFYGDMRLAGNH